MVSVSHVRFQGPKRLTVSHSVESISRLLNPQVCIFKSSLGMITHLAYRSNTRLRLFRRRRATTLYLSTITFVCIRFLFRRNFGPWLISHVSLMQFKFLKRTVSLVERQLSHSAALWSELCIQLTLRRKRLVILPLSETVISKDSHLIPTWHLNTPWSFDIHNRETLRLWESHNGNQEVDHVKYKNHSKHDYTNTIDCRVVTAAS
jgi:hypothetical protein